MDARNGDPPSPTLSNMPMLLAVTAQGSNSEAPYDNQQTDPSMKTSTGSKVDTKLLQQQNRRMKDELEALSQERDALQDGMDNVLLDLMAAQSELKDSQQKTAEKGITITQLEEEVKRLSDLAAKKDRQLLELEKQSRAQDEALQRQSQELAQAIDRERQLEHELARDTIEAQLLELQKSQDQQVSEASQAKALYALQKQLAFYKTNAERVSKWAREVEAANKQLQVSLKDKESLLHEQGLEMAALRSQAEERP